MKAEGKRTNELRSTIDRRFYKIKSNWVNVEPYWDEGLHFIKGMYSYKYRSYKSWKYNRKTQYK